MNDLVYCPLLEKWPDEGTIERDTNNWIPASIAKARPKEM